MTKWYVRPLRFFGAVGDFVIDVKIGLDLGRPLDDALRVARIMWGTRR
jgi:hypothetical protein